MGQLANVPSEAIVNEVIREWASMMRIADWQIDFAWATDLEIKDRCNGKAGNVAICSRNRLLKQALIEINPKQYDTEKDWQHVLAHEMYHIVTDDSQYHASCLLDYVPEETYKTFENQLDMYYERLVDDLAKGFVAALRKENDNGTNTSAKGGISEDAGGEETSNAQQDSKTHGEEGHG